MASKELIEKVASHFEFPDSATTLVTAENILLDILAAIQEPTEIMMQAYWDGSEASDSWELMLNASALGEQSE